MTLVLEGGHWWQVEAVAAERSRMAGYIARVGDLPGRCADCAFREGTPASRSLLVLHLVERCLREPDNNFCCHHGEPDRPCVGFSELRAQMNRTCENER